MGLFKKVFDFVTKSRQRKEEGKPKLPTPSWGDEFARENAAAKKKIQDLWDEYERQRQRKAPGNTRQEEIDRAERKAPPKPSTNDTNDKPPPQAPPQTVDQAEWQTMNSTNVDRIRWGRDDHLLQVIFKKTGALYQYWDVEPETYLAFLQTHSPGQFVWYVLRQFGYRYAKLSTGHATAKPSGNRFEGEPFAVPEHIEKIQEKAGRKPSEGDKPIGGGYKEMWNFGTPTARKHRAPPVP